MVITFAFAIILAGGVFMIDHAIPINTLPLFKFSHDNIQKSKKTKYFRPGFYCTIIR